MKASIVVVPVICSLFLGCTATNTERPVDGQPIQQQTASSQPEPDLGVVVAPEGAIVDADGFVRMPGEPSRGGSAYVVTGDVCEQFTTKFLTGLTGKKILRASPGLSIENSVCQYYISAENKNMMFQVGVEFRSVENQRQGNEVLGRKVAFDARIPMENFVAIQEDGLINRIYLILGPEKYISIDRSAADALTEAETLNLAVKLAEKVKDFR